MTNRYAKRFAALKAQGQKAFIPFTLLGWPDNKRSFDLVQTMVTSGVSALELGFPFSDPMSDGPIIQAAAAEALKEGFTVTRGFELLKKIRQLDDEIPIGLLVYYNLISKRGIEAFFMEASQSGVDGILIPDLPPELAQEVYPAASKHGVQLIFIVSPLTQPERLKLILKYAGGFLYVVSRLGITGTEARYDEDLAALIQRIQSQTILPCCIGFGISTPEQAKHMVSLGADGVITGSRIIQLVQEDPAKLADFLKAMQATLSVGM